MKRMMLTILTLLFPAALMADGSALVSDSEIDFRVSAPSEVAAGQQFRLTFSLNERPDDFQAPDLSDFRILSGPGQSSSSSTQIINNQVTTTVSFSYSYVIQAREEGEFTIGPAGVVVEGETHYTETVTIKVVPSDSRPSGQEREQTPADSGADQPTEKDIFIRAEASNPEPFQGEQVIVTYRLYTRLPVTNYSIEALPGFQGMWSENITGSGQTSVSTTVVDGITYNVAEIRRMAVFPQRGGELRIDPMEVEMRVRMQQTERQRRPGSFFDDFFSGSPFDSFRTVSHMVVSNAVTLRVRSFPELNKPEGFRGITGNYELSASLQPQQLEVNDAANLRITIQGKGNLMMLEDPSVDFPEELDVFDPEIDDNFTRSREGITGSRTFDYLIIPRQGGNFTVPEIRLSFFDPETQIYVTRQAGPFDLNVSGDAMAARERGSGPAIARLANDIRFISLEEDSWQPVGYVFFRSISFYLLFIFPLLLLALFIYLMNKQRELKQDVTGQRTRKARKLARKRLKKAAAAMKNGAEDTFYDEVFRALWGYVSDKLNIPVSRLNKENVTARFRDKKVPETLANKFLEGLRTCEFARFAPAGIDVPMEDIYQKALETIITLEKELRS